MAVSKSGKNDTKKNGLRDGDKTVQNTPKMILPVGPAIAGWQRRPKTNQATPFISSSTPPKTKNRMH
jgi:hypothetical protein